MPRLITVPGARCIEGFTGGLVWFSLPFMPFEKKYKIQLTDSTFRRMDESPDEQFYRIARFTSHIDAGAIDRVTGLYREYLSAGMAVLDLMSSWLSHLPEEMEFSRVVGLGMNDREMTRNQQLDQWVVQNLNQEPSLPFIDGEFDAGLICVSIDYLTDPVSVLRDLGRALRPDAPLVITYSNRFFESKATAAWLYLNDEQRAYLIKTFLEEAGCYRDIEMMDRSPPSGDPLFAVVARVA
ncbi:class I SAM-dependent methyltransferase [Porticoccus sp.]|uniref:class I SAM-dependent methyltransferase n=1 Tax=Porticoccus sp. TaxID=2024853 RepID=UPI003F69C4C9